MKYCAECKQLFSDDTDVCEICENELNAVNDEDKIFIASVTAIEKERIKIVLEDNSIDVDEEKRDGKRDLFVEYKDYDKAVDILIDIDALPKDYKKNKDKTIAERKNQKQTANKSESDAKATDKSSKTNEKPENKNDSKKNNDKKKTSAKKMEAIASEDSDKTVYELFDFQSLSRGKRLLTGAILWILFIAIIFCIVAGVDMGVEFIKKLFT